MIRKIKWIEYDRLGKLPLERRSVLVMIAQRQSEESKRAHEEFGGDQDFKDTAATVAVGYIRIHSDGPFFVVPGVPHKDEDITHWADCLGDDFTAPLWLSKQVVGKPRRQWREYDGNGIHMSPVTSEERFGIKRTTP